MGGNEYYHTKVLLASIHYHGWKGWKSTAETHDWCLVAGEKQCSVDFELLFTQGGFHKVSL